MSIKKLKLDLQSKKLRVAFIKDMVKEGRQFDEIEKLTKLAFSP